MADFTTASVSAVRDTIITLQPSAAKISAVARPMPFEPPVISAVLPASFRSMKSPWRYAKKTNYGGAGAAQQQACRLSHGRLDHAANALAMADFRAKAEIARCRFDIDRSARCGGFRAVDLETQRIARGTACSRDIVGRHPLGMRGEIGELLALPREAGRNRRIRGVVDINVRPIGQWLEPRRFAGERGAHDGVDVRSEERRVGKEWTAGGAAVESKEK